MSPRLRANLVRVAIALAVVAGVAWFVKSRSETRSRPAPKVQAHGGTGSGAKDGAPSAGGARGGPKGGGDRVVPVRVAIAEQTDLPVWLEGLGTVQAFQQVTVRAQVDGRLDKVAFTEGQTVKKGELLAQIDPRPFRVKLLQAQGALARDKAQLESLKKQYERFKSLHAQNLVAQQQVDEVAGQFGALEGAVKIDQASVEEALLQLDYAQVKAPIDGITGVRLVDAGNLIKASDPTGIVVITAIDPAAVLFTIPQDRLGAIATAMQAGEVKVEIFNRDGSQKLATGVVAVLDNQINQSTSTLRLKAHVPNPTRVLWPNAFVKARMLVETRKGVLVIPAVAIQRGPQGTYVYVATAEKTAEMRPVTVDLSTMDRAVITKGLSVGDRVVIEGANQLRPGGNVEVIEAPSGSASGPVGKK
ncbi:MAG: efflux RND transporter periplasmic adaptor subunit [Kofleriaceae bacterium]